jgi:hypothetical protein
MGQVGEELLDVGHRPEIKKPPQIRRLQGLPRWAILRSFRFIIEKSGQASVSYKL